MTGSEVRGAEQTGQAAESGQIPDAWIVSGSDTREVCIWDGQSKALLQRIEGHSGKSRTPLPASYAYILPYPPIYYRTGSMLADRVLRKYLALGI